MTAFHASGGGVELAWRKVSSLIALSLAVYKFSSLEGFTCWLGKADLLPLLWGGRSCVSIANNRFGEGVHPVRVNTRHCEAFLLDFQAGSVYSCHSEDEIRRIQKRLTFTQTQELSGSFEQSSQDDRGKCNGLVGLLTSLKDECKKYKTVTNFSTFQPFNCSTLREVVHHA